MEKINKADKYLRAKKKVEEIRGFYGNLTAYLIVIPVLAWFNYRTTDFPWVIFPAVGWGLGVILNGLCAFGYSPILGKNWEERKIKEYMSDNQF
ncbi:MAG: 2TM domain-containing protein [Flavobacteriaceae bacterium]|nr:2TM domain-containing protein [Eudoraea sp.]MBT8311508.1 2TM domain-containing protein [Eudoraea sp.]NNJ37908.1 2TM domain-containing protein [Flavobacteriaceae bacterium]NNJ39819.1 2TM domain-containing protein [Eudoraea sp.]